MNGPGSATETVDHVVSAAYLVPRANARGTVHSVFARACNLRLDDTLVTVHDASLPHSPTSVRVAAAGPGPWSPRVTPGDPVTLRSGVLSFGRHTVDLHRAAVWTPDPPPRRPEPQSARRRLAVAEALRRTHLHRDRGGRALADVDDEVTALREVLTARLTATPADTASRAELTAAVARLVGRGIGLTPTGDDILVGVLAAFTVAGGPAVAGAAVLGELRTAVADRARTTTDISAHYLRLAVAGHVGEALGAVRSAVLTDVDDRVLALRVHDLLAVGASSGADALRGLVLGLDLVLDLPSDRLTDKLTDKKVMV